MDAWQELSAAKNDAVWRHFYDQFDFRPRVHPSDFPGIKEPMPSITYSISAYYNRDAAEAEALETDLATKTLAAFQSIVQPGRLLYALDWQHTCYWLFPHCSFDAENLEGWRVPVLPNGDYYIFLAEDFSFGVFGHPWEQSVCVFGQALLDAFELNEPTIFRGILRKNGIAV